ncbi:MAG: sigma 54-interacting transcriptional regulator, partial [Rectinemataceae bacterium]
MRIGDTKIIPVSVRVITASNIPLQEEVKRGRIRKDLYYRLNVLEINIPPLRARKGDVEHLFMLFLTKMAARKHSPLKVNVPDSLLRVLSDYEWPGNVRELENLAERYFTLYYLFGERAASIVISSIESSKNNPNKSEPGGDFLIGTLREIEDRIIHHVYIQEGENISRTAKRLDLDRVTIRKRLKK